MPDRSAAAMREGVVGSLCVIAIVTGSTTEPDDPDGEKGARNAYFARPFCIQELRWAREASVMIQPVILIEDKTRIGEFLGGAPSDLKDLGNTDFIELIRSDNEFWDVGLKKIIRAADKSRAKRGHGR